MSKAYLKPVKESKHALAKLALERDAQRPAFHFTSHASMTAPQSKFLRQLADKEEYLRESAEYNRTMASSFGGDRMVLPQKFQSRPLDYQVHSLLGGSLNDETLLSHDVPVASRMLRVSQSAQSRRRSSTPLSTIGSVLSQGAPVPRAKEYTNEQLANIAEDLAYEWDRNAQNSGPLSPQRLRAEQPVGMSPSRNPAPQRIRRSHNGYSSPCVALPSRSHTVLSERGPWPDEQTHPLTAGGSPTRYPNVRPSPVDEPSQEELRLDTDDRFTTSSRVAARRIQTAQQYAIKEAQTNIYLPVTTHRLGKGKEEKPPPRIIPDGRRRKPSDTRDKNIIFLR